MWAGGLGIELRYPLDMGEKNVHLDSSILLIPWHYQLIHFIFFSIERLYTVLEDNILRNEFLSLNNKHLELLIQLRRLTRERYSE